MWGKNKKYAKKKPLSWNFPPESEDFINIFVFHTREISEKQSHDLCGTIIPALQRAVPFYVINLKTVHSLLSISQNTD